MRLIRRSSIPFALLALSVSGYAQVVVAPPTPAPDAAEPAASPPLISIEGPSPAPAPGSSITDYTPAPTNSFTANALLGYVCDRPIFAGDLFRPIDDQLRKIAASAAGPDEFQVKAATLIQSELQRRVSDVVVVTAAEATLTDSDRTNVDYYVAKQLASLKTKNGGSDAAAAKYLASIGSSIDQFRTDQRNDAIKGIYFERTLRPRITVTRQMELNYYDRNVAQYKKPAWVDLYTIQLPVQRWLHQSGPTGEEGPVIQSPTPEQIKTAEAQAMSVARRIIQAAKVPGADFAELVDRFNSRDLAASTGGRWPGGAAESNLANPVFRSFVFSLPANSIANEPLLLHDKDVANSAVVVVKVGEKRPAHTVSFNEAEPEIKTKLLDKALQDLESQEMQRLAASAPIERVDGRDALSVAIETAVARYFRK